MDSELHYYTPNFLVIDQFCYIDLRLLHIWYSGLKVSSDHDPVRKEK
jgi:hypothetical protein